MNTTPEQLRLAADIIQNGWEWEYLLGSEWKNRGNGILSYLHDGVEIRRKPLSFPPIPEGMTLHNPDGLTAEQVGDGYRLCVLEELDGRHKAISEMYWPSNAHRWSGSGSSAHVIPEKKNCGITYRVPISTPFPDGSRIVDGKLVKPWVPKFKVGDRVKGISTGAILGKVVAIREGTQCYEVGDGSYIGSFGDDQLTLAPWSLTRHIPGFRPLRENEQWHRSDWTEEMLEGGWRPLLLGEVPQPHAGDCFENGDRCQESPGAVSYMVRLKTRRQLPEPPKLVPLGPSDVPPGSVLRWKSWGKRPDEPECWVVVLQVTVVDGLLIGSTGTEWVKWDRLMSDFEILRPGQTDWQACSKTA